jgi:hypothetical protein
LIEEGGLSGIIDWADIAAGDRATDLASIRRKNLFGLLVSRFKCQHRLCSPSRFSERLRNHWFFCGPVLLIQSGPTLPMMILSAIIEVVEARVFLGPNLLFCAEVFDSELVGKSWSAKFPLLLGGGLEPALRVFFSTIFHGIALKKH